MLTVVFWIVAVVMLVLAVAVLGRVLAVVLGLAVCVAILGAPAFVVAGLAIDHFGMAGTDGQFFTIMVPIMLAELVAIVALACWRDRLAAA